MLERKKLLPYPKHIPRISEPVSEKWYENKKRKLRRWYKIYLATTLSVVFFTAAFLVISFGEGYSSMDIPLSDRIASFILSKTFRDLSGNHNNTITDSEDSQNGLLEDMLDQFIPPSNGNPPSITPNPPSDNENNAATDSYDGIYVFDHTKVPEGEKGIIPMDLSLSSSGVTYIHNSTGYSPNTAELLKKELKRGQVTPLSAAYRPLVLVIHTHGTEAYSPKGAISYSENNSDYARSSDTSENVVSVGAVLAGTLNKAGISTLHCTIMHDSVAYKDSYARAENTIKQYLEKYPSIKLVIDLHRDAVVKSSGELVRPVTLVNGERTAQLMCVVGSDWGGERYDHWEDNLSLALKLRESLNQKYGNLCRPTYLKSSTYNQELSPYSLLLEVGASGNDLDEAKRAAALAAEELIPLILSM